MAVRQAASPLIALLLALLLAAALLVSARADTLTPEDLAAEEAAAAAVGEAAEEEDDDDDDGALNEDADAARLRPDRHPLSDMPPPRDDVTVAHAFARGLDARNVLTLGEPVKAVVALANEGRARLHVWGLMGSLNRIDAFDTHVQNFTYGSVNKTVEPGAELSFSYEMVPNERLDTRPFQMAISVFYETRSGSGNAISGHATTFYNQTVGTEVGKGTMSNGVFMGIFAAVLVGVAGGVYLLRASEVKPNAGVEMGTGDTSKNEWLEEHQAMVGAGGGRARRGGDMGR